LYPTEETLSTPHALFEIDGHTATLTFKRPEARNAMTWAMYDALVDACDRTDSDPSVRVLVLRGAGGRAFVAGTDIAQFQSFRTADDGLTYEHRIDAVLDRLERVAKPTIAAIQGVAAGGGCAIALTCDLRIATPESTLGVPVARTLGNCLSGATCARLADVIGPARVKDLLYTGRLVGADEALAFGMLTRVVQPDALDEAVRQLASEIASNAPLTIRVTKELLRRIASKRRLDPGADRDLVELCYTSDDFREGVTAFLSKRRPEWTGR
jgi:enoyl-CoA hydratase/carnithine racemase